MYIKMRALFVVIVMVSVSFIGSMKLYSQETFYIKKTDKTVISIPTSEIETMYFSKSGTLNETVVPVDGVTDIDGNVYNTIKIGTQTWMQSDLKVTKYNTGASIPLVIKNDKWKKLTTGGYSWYDNKEFDKSSPYGAFYNGFVVKSGNICPKGWHVPSKEDWYILKASCDEGLYCGRALKEVGTLHWKKNKDATNKTGFTALPTGMRKSSGSFDWREASGHLWSTTEKKNNKSSTFFSLSIVSHTSFIYDSFYNMNTGNCIRCIKDEY
ncbi:MAG: fibrobacter succinogenes major paralogous domain-containing protein [Candidatus Delongbacteria bacterium]|nr:fibrobacter succinogenes major paralogous domain-containing protein [Candidatus Delongbacteria bacterium]